MQIAISPKIKNEFKDYFYITLGLMLYTFGWTLFLLPYQIVTGGVTGVAAVIYYGTGIPIFLSYFIINAILLVAALKILGLKFMVKTIYAIGMLSVLLALAQDHLMGPHGELIQILGPGQDFMSLIIGCCFTGLSLAIVFLHNGSTGGTDIIAAIVNKYHNISLGRVLIFVDLVIVGSSFFVFNAKPDFTTIDAIRKVVFGLCTMVIENLVGSGQNCWRVPRRSVSPSASPTQSRSRLSPTTTFLAMLARRLPSASRTHSGSSFGAISLT